MIVYVESVKKKSLKQLVSFSSRHVDTNSKNVFGQPRLRASLRDLRSPRRTYKSTIEDDLKKLIIMDSPGDTPQRDPVRNLSDRADVNSAAGVNPSYPFPFQSPRRPLQRTFSDESLCSGRREASFANSDDPGAPSDVLFTATLPTRRHALSSQMQAKKSEFSPQRADVMLKRCSWMQMFDSLQLSRSQCLCQPPSSLSPKSETKSPR